MTKDSADTKYEEIEETGITGVPESEPKSEKKRRRKRGNWSGKWDIELIELENTTKSIMWVEPVIQILHINENYLQNSSLGFRRLSDFQTSFVR